MFQRRYVELSQIIALAVLAVAVPLVTTGTWLVPMLYGQEFGGAGALLACLALMQALRILRITPTLVAMARGDTKTALVANLWRSLALPAALAVAFGGGSTLGIALAGLSGEVLALAVSLRRMARLHDLPVGPWLKHNAGVAASLAAAELARRWVGPSPAAGLLAAAVLTLLPCGVMLATWPAARRALALVRAET